MTAASPPVNPMNPNGDGFITSTGLAFSGPLDETQFELPFIALQGFETEPGADNQYAAGCEFYELTSNASEGADPAYFYFSNPDGIADNGDEKLIFRFRVARFSNGVTAFSILVDTDYAFGFEGAEADVNAVTGNPGFEREIALFNNTGAEGGVRVYNVDGMAQPTTPIFSAALSSNYQVSYALNQDPSCAARVPVFVDMYVPFSTLGISSSRQIRMAAAANEDIASSLNGGASDIGGIDGNRLPDDDIQFVTLVNNYFPIRADQPANAAPRGVNTTVALNENSPDGLILHSVSASDPNGDVLSYAIDRGNPNNAFAIDATTGKLSINNSNALDHELAPSFTLVIRVSDGSLYDNVVVTINLNDLNDNPPSAPDASVFLNENSLIGAIAYSVAATDADETSTLTYALTGGNGSSVFALDKASGVITVADMLALDFESVQALTLNIQVTDGLFFDNAVITINLLNVNEPPSVADKTLAIKENTNANAVISVLQGTDPDNGQILYYSIKGGNTAGAFAVNALTGEISVDNPIAVNFEDVSTFNLIVSVSDGQYSDDAFIVINLTDVNEPPVVMGAAVQFGDTLRDGEVIHLAVAADEDAGDIITYSIASGSEFPLFTIDSQTGEVMIAGLEELVPGAFTYEVLITATDGRGLSGTGILVVGIEKRAIWPEKGFSPNGDETNDFWRIDGIEGFPDNTVKVYNRWGHQVTEVSNYDNNERVWRGEETQVSAQIESTYFFIIRTGKFRPITGYVIVKP